MEAGNLAMVYALIGEQDTAITLIERLLSTTGPFAGPGTDMPSDITLADLHLRWNGTPCEIIRASRRSSLDRSLRQY
jgi:hypothetical protein